MEKLKNKVAFVTGGSRGIGAAIAKRLSREGANVAITYSTSADKAAQVVNEMRKQGGKAIAIQADNTNAEALNNAIAQAAAELGGIHVLVNNAGIGVYKDINDFSLEDFDRIMAVNVRAVFAGSKAVLKYLGKGGRIINIGSCQGERIPTPGGSLYAMSKSALIGFTKGMARDVGPLGVTVNLVQPGPIDTDMNPVDGPDANYQRSIMALSQFGNAEDIASMVAYLAGPESAYVTGAVITVDGGTNC